MQEPGSCNETKLTFRKVNRMKKTKNTTLSEQFQNPIKKMCGNKCKFDTPNTIYLFKSFIKKETFYFTKNA